MTANDLDRRAFVRAAGALLLAGSGFRDFAPRSTPRTLSVVLVPRAPEAVSRGARLAAEEAAHAGELLGWRLVLSEADVLLHGDIDGVAAFIGGYDEGSARTLAQAAARLDSVVVVNVGGRADALRGECARNVFHVQASDRMYADALAARAGDAVAATDAVLWHPSLERFGAAQLNDRFRARFGVPMDGAAWAGWMAVKVVWEASLRARTVEGAGIRAYLERASTQFDGHKGWPLSFRAWDHQLRQPLYLVSADGTRVVGEVPARTVDGGASSRELLDRLGADASACAASGAVD